MISEAPKRFDLEDRTHAFARDVSGLVRHLPKTVWNLEYMKQLIRSSGSVGANYIEANEALGKLDFAKQIRIALKESKESIHWLDLLDCGDGQQLDNEKKRLIGEADQLVRIFCAILQKVGAKTIKQIL